jgi:NAD(P)-dependent dehydrogenase (short-subunit alcohol dehydrogenase family)
MKRVLIVGGANGIGLSIAKVLSARDETEKIYNEAKTIVEKVIYKLARDIFEDESDKFKWGEY